MADLNIRTPDWWRQRLEYDPETGVLLHRERPLSDFQSQRIWRAWNSRCAGKPAFASKADRGYLVGRYGGVNYYAHRLIWLIVYDEEPQIIDHVSGDGTDNRLCNLRSVSHADNLRNMRLRKNNSSGVLGVSQQRGRWRTRISGEEIGIFETFEEAVRARRKAEHMRGFHQNHGRRGAA